MAEDEVPWEAHLNWLEKSLRNEARRIFIAEEAGLPVATVRFDLLTDPSGWELSWTVAPEARGRGVGTKLVQAALQVSPGPHVWARVRKHNLSSIAIARKVGMQFKRYDDDLMWFAVVL